MDSQVENYIIQSRQAQKSDDQIRQELLNAGWDKKTVDDALNSNGDAKSFKLYTGKAPWPVQIVGGLMWLQGLDLIFTAIIPGLLLWAVYGILGILYSAGLIILATFIIRYAKGVFKMKTTVFKKAIIFQIIILVASAYLSFYQGLNKINYQMLFSVFVAGLSIIILYSYKQKFVY